MLVWCPDWPVIAAEIVEGVTAAGPVVVLHGNRVVACSETARLEGVRRGLRRREAQSRCPALVVVEHDPGRDARAFEPVVAAVEEVAVGVEVIRPGACALAARGPSRYFGGEEAAAERIVEQIAETCSVESQVGIADGVFAAGLAARAGRVIAPGETRAFLAGVPIEALERPELTDLLKRLGVKTLGDFAALPAGDVLTRFGFDGALAHRLAAGFDHRPLAVRRPPPDLDVADTYDDPLERVDVAAFAGRVLAERLHDKLTAHGLACTRLGIEAVTADGQELHRVWRHDGTLTAAAIAERVRWQLDGWLTGGRRGAPARPTAGLVRLRLIPDGVLVHLGLQPGLWGDAGAERERAHRAFSRVQGLLGPESVVTPVLGGGRSADDQVRLVPWGDERDPARPSAAHPDPIPGTTITPVLTRSVAPPLTLALLPPSPERDDGEEAGAWLAGRETRPAGRDPEQTAGGSETPAVRAEPGEGGSETTAVRAEPGEGGSVIPMRSRRRQTDTDVSGPSQQPAADGMASVSRLPGPVAARDAEGVTGNVGQAAGSAAVGDADRVAGSVGTGAGRVAESAWAGDAGQVAGSGAEAGGPAAGSLEDGPPAGTTLVTLRPGRRKAGGGRRAAKSAALPPWPGRLPRPAPAVVLPRPVAAVVLDGTGTPVAVSARLELTGDPAALVVESAPPVEISGWAGPWPVDERGWAPAEARRRARFQVALVDGRALLLALAGGLWAVEAIYD
jgi:protein ImuB